MKTIEANIIRSFAEVRKEIDDLRDQLKILEAHQSSLLKRAKDATKKTKSRKVKKK